MAKVLVVDDEPNIVLSLEFLMEQAGFEVVTAEDGEQALARVNESQPDLLLLDISLPGISGFDVLERLRSEAATAQLPIIMLTAHGRDVEREKGMALGADDYITKPFSMEELIFRIEAILRRMSDSKGSEQSTYQLGKYVFDHRKQTLATDESVVKLTTKESELLRLLCNNANDVLERNFALKTIWIDDNYFNARSMDVYITKLRKHLKDEPSVEIINVHGKGYKLIM